MKYLVQIDGRSFQVEIENLDARPVIAVVDGQAFEVWPGPDGASQYEIKQPTRPATRPAGSKAVPSPETRKLSPHQPAPLLGANGGMKLVRAPIPGVIISVAIEVGEEVNAGQELCVLEAMKMKNAIRATRAGVIADVLVAPGQQVKHNDPLVEYTE
jgi:glutaconyl-CoA/methylmalonyl-CoA decarboxylase subunit gamma